MPEISWMYVVRIYRIPFVFRDGFMGHYFVQGGSVAQLQPSSVGSALIYHPVAEKYRATLGSWHNPPGVLRS
jgi:hypothetical protein